MCRNQEALTSCTQATHRYFLSASVSQLQTIVIELSRSCARLSQILKWKGFCYWKKKLPQISSSIHQFWIDVNMIYHFESCLAIPQLYNRSVVPESGTISSLVHSLAEGVPNQRIALISTNLVSPSKRTKFPVRFLCIHRHVNHSTSTRAWLCLFGPCFSYVKLALEKEGIEFKHFCI